MPRIGVFVCDCGTNIAGFLDVPVVCEYAKSLPDVVYVKENMYTCSNAGLQEIINAIKEYKLDRVVVASCTPRTHEPLFRKACEMAGLNKFLFEFVNIRDQCSWVHQKEREKATEKAKDLIRMGVAKARLLEPLEEIKIPVEKSCLIIGGGISGLTSAVALAKQGIEVHLVEKEDRLGGILNYIYKVYPEDEEASKVLKDAVEEVKKYRNINIYLSSKVEKIDGYIGNFNVLIRGKINKEIKVGTIIVAIGAKPYQPTYMYNYQEYENIITQIELEKMLKENKLKGNDFVFIQCVGGRGERVRYCSRICCMNSVKNARIIKKMIPDSNVYIIHKGLQSYGVKYEEYVRKAREEGVRFIRVSDSIPTVSSIERKDGKIFVGLYHPGLRRKIELPADLVILSTPLVESEDAKKISQMLKVPLGLDGFFFEAHVKLRPVDFATDGIYMCGSCRAPATIEEAKIQALAAAGRASIPMLNGFVKVEPYTPYIDENKCMGCGMCVEVCPYGAMIIVEKNGKKVAENIPAACKGCGACSSSCIHKAIDMKHFRDEQIVAEIEVID
ncbi:MAG: CoB--CoM heterodisulfide reductase iron-sulfur subunit A family protein [Thermoplasmatales archaeon]|nr:CoB--CoM heterodisulfide reductase iron-sulfur subunit A family protein [Thermoplasmatales archaeon]